MALGDIHLRFAWQAWYFRALGWLWWRAWTGLVAGDAAALCVAGMALGDIHLRFAWQAWHLVTSTFVHTIFDLAWQAWHLVTSTFVLRGRRAWTGLVAGDAAALCVAGVALGDIHLRFAWQAWHLVTSTFVHTIFDLAWQACHLVTSTFVLRGRRAWTGLVAGDAAALCVAGVALGDIHLRFAWQAWHLVTSTFVSRGRRGTWSHTPLFCVAGMALMASLCGVLVFDSVSRLLRLLLLGRLLFTHHLSSTHHLCHSPSFAYNFVTHHLSHTTLSHTIFHTRLGHTPSFTHHLSHTIFVNHLCEPSLSTTIFHTPSFTHHLLQTHIFTHHLSHTISHTHLCQPPSFTHHLSHTIF